MRFEWDENKAASNEAKHGVSFEEAKRVFYDAHAVILFDEEHSWNEQRMKIIGAINSRLLVVIYVEIVEDLIRIITAFEAGTREKRLYYED